MVWSAFGISLDVEGDLEMTGVRVIGTAVIGVILFGGLFGLFLGGLFGLFLRGPLRARTFLALFLRVAGVSIAGAGGLLAGIALSSVSSLSSPLMWSMLSSAVPGRVSTVSDCSGRSMVGLSSEEVSLSPLPSPSVVWSVLSPVEATAGPSRQGSPPPAPGSCSRRSGRGLRYCQPAGRWSPAGRSHPCRTGLRLRRHRTCQPSC